MTIDQYVREQVTKAQVHNPDIKYLDAYLFFLNAGLNFDSQFGGLENTYHQRTQFMKGALKDYLARECKK